MPWDLIQIKNKLHCKVLHELLDNLSLIIRLLNCDYGTALLENCQESLFSTNLNTKLEHTYYHYRQCATLCLPSPGFQNPKGYEMVSRGVG